MCRLSKRRRGMQNKNMDTGSEDEIAWKMRSGLQADGGVVSDGEREKAATDGEGGEGSRRCQVGEETQRAWLILH